MQFTFKLMDEVRVFMRRNIHGESEFLEMKRHA
jgi:hypothetical protein